MKQAIFSNPRPCFASVRESWRRSYCYLASESSGSTLSGPVQGSPTTANRRGQGREGQGRRMGPESDRLARRGQDGARALICDGVDGGATPDTDPRGGGRRD